MPLEKRKKQESRRLFFRQAERAECNGTRALRRIRAVY